MNQCYSKQGVTLKILDMFEDRAICPLYPSVLYDNDFHHAIIISLPVPYSHE